MVRRRSFALLGALLGAPACVSDRLDGYLAALADCSSTGDSEATTGEDASGDTTADGTGMTTAASMEGTTTGEASTADETSTGGTESATTVEESGSSSSSGSSSGGEPVCGNGVLEEFGAVPEECDDGNLEPSDGCDDSCALDRVVFVSSDEYKGGELESTKIADAFCANLADDAGFPDGLRYRAWLSDSDEDARDRFKRGRGRLVLVNGLVVAESWAALLAGEMQNPISVTEKSETYITRVWTGTRPDGTKVPNAEFCADWSSSSFMTTGHFGDSEELGPAWTLSNAASNPDVCIADYAIYCFQSL